MDKSSCSGLLSASGEHPGSLVVNVVESEVLGLKFPTDHVDDDIRVLHRFHHTLFVLQVEFSEQNLQFCIDIQLQIFNPIQVWKMFGCGFQHHNYIFFVEFLEEDFHIFSKLSFLFVVAFVKKF